MSRDRRADRMMRDFGRRLRAARITAGYEEAADFAEDLGIEAPRYRRWERGEVFPSAYFLAQIAELTDKSLDWLIAGKPLGKPRDQ